MFSALHRIRRHLLPAAAPLTSLTAAAGAAAAAAGSRGGDGGGVGAASASSPSICPCRAEMPPLPTLSSASARCLFPFLNATSLGFGVCCCLPNPPSCSCLSASPLATSAALTTHGLRVLRSAPPTAGVAATSVQNVSAAGSGAGANLHARMFASVHPAAGAGAVSGISRADNDAYPVASAAAARNGSCRSWRRQSRSSVLAVGTDGPAPDDDVAAAAAAIPPGVSFLGDDVGTGDRNHSVLVSSREGVGEGMGEVAVLASIAERPEASPPAPPGTWATVAAASSPASSSSSQFVKPRVARDLQYTRVPCRSCAGSGILSCTQCGGQGSLPPGGFHRRNPVNINRIVGSKWTAMERTFGWRHFRVDSKRKAGGKDWFVEMVATCDDTTRFWVNAQNLKDRTRWTMGWMQKDELLALTGDGGDATKRVTCKACKGEGKVRCPNCAKQKRDEQGARRTVEVIDV